MISRFSYDKPSISDTPIYDSLYLRSYLPDIHAPRFSRSESLNLISQRKKRKKNYRFQPERESLFDCSRSGNYNIKRDSNCDGVLFKNSIRKRKPQNVSGFDPRLFSFFLFFPPRAINRGQGENSGGEQCAYRAAYKCGSRSPESAESF